jgi:hypothetical protein
MGINPDDSQYIIQERRSNPFTMGDLASQGRLSSRLANITINNQSIASFLTDGSTGYYKVYSYATVGDYTKKIEAIVNGNMISYWRAW